jgi:hypothetical protein
VSGEGIHTKIEIKGTMFKAEKHLNTFWFCKLLGKIKYVSTKAMGCIGTALSVRRQPAMIK